MMSGLALLVVLLGAGYVLGVAGFFRGLGHSGRVDRLGWRVSELEHARSELEAEVQRLRRLLEAQSGAAASPAKSVAETGSAARSLEPAASPEPEREDRASPSAAQAASAGKADMPSGTESTASGAPQPTGWVDEALQEWRSARKTGPAGPGLEERLGTRWAVWVGGAALALGALLLVRYTIEQGYFGPGLRVLMGTLFSAALIAGGEWLRRGEVKLELAGEGAAHIPSVVTAAGTVGAFGTIYAAHALYGFIGPAAAFTLLGLVGLAALWAATLHGQALAGLGLAGSLLAPLLVSSATPNPWPVIVYLAIVGVAARVLAERQSWRWLEFAAGAGGLLWGFIFVLEATNLESWSAPAMTHTLVQLAIAAGFLAWPRPEGRAGQASDEPDALGSGVLLAFALLGLAVFGANAGLSPASVVFAVLMVAILAAAGLLQVSLSPAVPIAALSALAKLVIWPSLFGSRLFPVPGSVEPLDLWTPPFQPALFLLFAAVVALSIAAASAARLLATPTAGPWRAACLAGTAALLPLAALVIVYARISNFNTSIVLALAALALAAAFAAGVVVFETASKRARTPALTLGIGALAAAAVAALSLALVFYLDRGALTVAIALTALGTAYVADLKKIAMLRYAVIALGVAVLGRLLWDPRVMGDDLGTTPLLNWLLFGYGVPAVAFYAAARLLAKDADDIATRLSDALALVFAGLLVFFEIRHFLHGGDILALKTDHVEQGLLALAAIGISFALLKSGIGRGNPIYRAASLAFAAVSLVNIVIGLGLHDNPYLQLDETIRGGVLLNTLVLGYLMPALAAALLARHAKGRWPEIAQMLAGSLALALLFGFVSLQVRHAFQGADVHFWRATGDAEFWSYSAAWLVLGILLLAYGLWRGMVEARIASALLVTLVVLKVFLWDLAGLEGVLRALSFIGLGLVLLGIGTVYQRLVFTRAAPRGGQG